MAGYSSTAQARKLGLKPGSRLALDRAPDGWSLVEPPDVRIVTDGEPADVVISFVRAAVELTDRVEQLGRQIFPDGAVAAIDDDWSGLKIVWRRENRGR